MTAATGVGTVSFDVLGMAVLPCNRRCLSALGLLRRLLQVAPIVVVGITA